MRFIFVINVRNNESPEQLGYRQKHPTTKPTSYTLWLIWSCFVADMVCGRYGIGPGPNGDELPRSGPCSMWNSYFSSFYRVHCSAIQILLWKLFIAYCTTSENATETYFHSDVHCFNFLILFLIDCHYSVVIGALQMSRWRWWWRWLWCDAGGQKTKGAITSKIKHAIKLKTSPASLAQLLQPSLAFCFSSQWRRTVQDWTVRRHWLQAKTKC